MTVHTAGLVSAILLTMIGLGVYGQRPSARRLIIGMVSAVLLTAILILLTAVLHPEGNSTRLPLLFLLCVWSVLSCFRTEGATAPASAGIFLCFLVLSFHYSHMATSNSYTDNPGARERRVVLANRSLDRQHLDPLPSVEICPTWHTWLTGLYAVTSPADPASLSGATQEAR